MKKIIALVLAAIMVFGLAACGSNPEPSNTAAPAGSESTGAKKDLKDVKEEGNAAADEKADNVEVTLPAFFFEDEAEEDIQNDVKEMGITDYTVNSDGSVTLKMTKAKQKELLDELMSEFEETKKELLEGEDRVESFRSIENNDDFSRVDVYVDSESFESWDTFYSLAFFMTGAFYQAFNGVDADNVDMEVNFIDNETKEVLDSSTYQEFVESINAFADYEDEERPAPEELPTIEETVIFDSDGVTVTAEEYVYDSFWGEGIKVLIENNSDKTVSVSGDTLIVNDFMTYPMLSATVSAGKKAYETLYLSNEDLIEIGISNVGKIEIQLYLYDPDTYETICRGELVELRTSAYAEMDTVAEDAGEELYNDNGIRIVGEYHEAEGYDDANVLLYVENNTGKNISLSLEELSVNGFMVDSWYYESILDGKKSISSADLYADSLEECGIETIEEIECVFEASDSDSFSTLFKTVPITLYVG